MGLSINLECDDHQAAIAHNGTDALDYLRREHVDLIILDLILPDMSGFEALRTFRSAGVDAPVLILSARADEVDRVAGFRLGARMTTSPSRFRSSS